MPPVFWRSQSREKAYLKLPLSEDQRKEANDAIRALGSEPRPPGHKKLSGKRDTYRIVVCADYRVIYEIQRDAIVLIDVDDRKNVYR